MAVYYKISDTDTLAKLDNGRSYVFDSVAGDWVEDGSVLAGRLAAIDGSCVEISQEDAQQAMGNLEDGTQQ